MSPINKNTLTGSALTFVDPYFTEPKGGRSMVKKFLILITDGEAQDDVIDPAKALRDKGVVIFSVGVYGANRTQLEEISGDGSLVFQVESFDDLKSIESKLIFRVCALRDCKSIRQLDVVFVLDHSGSILPQDQESMINVIIHLVKKSDVGPDRVQFGALRYSDHPEVLFYLNTYSNRSAIIEHLRRPRGTGGNTFTARALKHANNLFMEEHGSRLKQNVKQMLIIITDGVSHDRNQLSDVASKLRAKGIIIYAVGVGKAEQEELETMAGNKNYTIHVSNFNKLKDIYLPLQDSMCTNAQEDCFLDIVVSFDISTHLLGQPLFHGHPRLESYLPGILEDITSLRGVSCGAGAEVQVSVAFKVNSDQNFPAKFQIYQETIFDSLLQVTVNGPTHLNAQFVQSMENMETMGLMDSMGKRAFMDFLGKREKRVIQDPR
ncbi:hypothetical protein J1605_021211 [Eschrichtius robustus]|uniref:VWFA domain-containing protein n=1 Tax=Eschrichtius robustus TaxID=9764 RepID=A0AB34HHU8_ESCRO|nr:hypothetical protein J1605_021211 [Eschrichtius robustus]